MCQVLGSTQWKDPKTWPYGCFRSRAANVLAQDTTHCVQALPTSEKAQVRSVPDSAYSVAVEQGTRRNGRMRGEQTEPPSLEREEP